MTTVRVEDDIKVELDRFQGELLAETGERLSHSELLARLLRFARRREAEFIASKDAEEWTPPTKEQLRKLLALGQDWGVRTSSRDIDRVLYGGKRPR